MAPYSTLLLPFRAARAYPRATAVRAAGGRGAGAPAAEVRFCRRRSWTQGEDRHFPAHHAAALLRPDAAGGPAGHGAAEADVGDSRPGRRRAAIAHHGPLRRLRAGA